MPKITDAAYGDLTSYVATFKLIGHDPTEGSITDQTKRLELQDFVNMLYQLIPRPGMMLNGKLSVTVSANDLIVALKTRAGTDPSTTDSVAININGTIRVVTAATSITLADATNWFNAGSAELATKEIDLFAYAIWDSNSSVVAIAPSRIPFGRLVSDFSATTTNEKHLGNYANYTSTDEVANIGRFAATLSAGAGYTWTVPTFTNSNLIQEPCFETRWLTWVPVVQAGNPTYGTVTYPLARYKVKDALVNYQFGCSGTGSGTAGTGIAFTLPFEAAQSALTDPPLLGPGWTSDGNVACQGFIIAGTPDLIKFFKYNLGNFTNSGTYTLRSTGFYEM